jgi:hypothetical protein
MPYCRTLLTVTGRFLYKTSGKESRLERYFIASQLPAEHTSSQWLAIIRGHWKGTEIGNHWQRDTIMGEDRTRSRNPNIVGAFALLNNAAHALMRRTFTMQPLSETIENMQSGPALALRLVTGPPAKG